MRCKQIFLLLSICVLAIGTSYGQWPTAVKVISINPNGATVENGQLETGYVLADLNWALKPTVGCFSNTDSRKFKGKQVFYASTLAAKTILDIKLVSKNPKSKMSLYAYLIPLEDFSIPPALDRCVTCRQASQGGVLLPGQEENGERKLRLNAIQKGYNVVIAVCGEEGVEKGSYTLTMETVK
ncbi:MAG: hypothetical protein ABIV51_08470 [Saprospiraceae bacterium]